MRVARVCRMYESLCVVSETVEGRRRPVYECAASKGCAAREGAFEAREGGGSGYLQF